MFSTSKAQCNLANVLKRNNQRSVCPTNMSAKRKRRHYPEECLVFKVQALKYTVQGSH